MTAKTNLQFTAAKQTKIAWNRNHCSANILDVLDIGCNVLCRLTALLCRNREIEKVRDLTQHETWRSRAGITRTFSLASTRSHALYQYGTRNK